MSSYLVLVIHLTHFKVELSSSNDTDVKIEFRQARLSLTLCFSLGDTMEIRKAEMNLLLVFC